MSTEVAAPLRYPPGRQPPPSGPRPPSRSRLPSLTGLRIFGSVAVVLCHVGNGFANARSLTVAAELLLLQAWSPDNPTYAGGNGVTWSLSVEMFFYLVFPLAQRDQLTFRGTAHQRPRTACFP